MNIIYKYSFYIIFFSLLFSINASFAGISDLKVKINTLIFQLAKKYSVAFVYDSVPSASWKEVTFTTVKTESDYNELLSYLKIFSAEFNKYPAAFVKKSNLKYVAFVRVLKLNEQHRSALPDAYKEILFLDILKGKHKDLYLGSKTPYYIKHTIHHEYYHLIEQEFNGSCMYKDSIWNSFNSSGFHYGTGGASMYPDMSKKHFFMLFRQKPYKLTHPQKGIINIYSATALEEDKAEIFTSLFIKRESRSVLKYIKADDIIQKKLNYMKIFIEKLCPTMNQSYWNSL